jgi:hypothetical protein
MEVYNSGTEINVLMFLSKKLCSLWLSTEHSLVHSSNEPTASDGRETIPYIYVYIQNVPGGKSIFWEDIVSLILSKKVYMYMCPIPR